VIRCSSVLATFRSLPCQFARSAGVIERRGIPTVKVSKEQFVAEYRRDPDVHRHSFESNCHVLGLDEAEVYRTSVNTGTVVLYTYAPQQYVCRTAVPLFTEICTLLLRPRRTMGANETTRSQMLAVADAIRVPSHGYSVASGVMH
jgi:hypothetical protein